MQKNIYKQVILIILARTCFSFFFFFYWNFRLPASSFWIHQFGLDFHIQKAQKGTRVGTEKQLKKPMNFCERWKTFNFFWVHLYLSMETIFYHNVGFFFFFSTVVNGSPSVPSKSSLHWWWFIFWQDCTHHRTWNFKW